MVHYCSRNPIHSVENIDFKLYTYSQDCLQLLWVMRFRVVCWKHCTWACRIQPWVSHSFTRLRRLVSYLSQHQAPTSLALSSLVAMWAGAVVASREWGTCATILAGLWVTVVCMDMITDEWMKKESNSSVFTQYYHTTSHICGHTHRYKPLQKSGKGWGSSCWPGECMHSQCDQVYTPYIPNLGLGTRLLCTLVPTTKVSSPASIISAGHLMWVWQ